jgi:hypothetical protein
MCSVSRDGEALPDSLRSVGLIARTPASPRRRWQRAGQHLPLKARQRIQAGRSKTNADVFEIVLKDVARPFGYVTFSQLASPAY